MSDDGLDSDFRVAKKLSALERENAALQKQVEQIERHDKEVMASCVRTGLALTQSRKQVEELDHRLGSERENVKLSEGQIAVLELQVEELRGVLEKCETDGQLLIDAARWIIQNYRNIHGICELSHGIGGLTSALTLAREALQKHRKEGMERVDLGQLTSKQITELMSEPSHDETLPSNAAITSNPEVAASQPEKIGGTYYCEWCEQEQDSAYIHICPNEPKNPEVAAHEWTAVQSSNPAYPHEWDVMEGGKSGYSVIGDGFITEDQAKSIAFSHNENLKGRLATYPPTEPSVAAESGFEEWWKNGVFLASKSGARAAWLAARVGWQPIRKSE